MWSILEEGRDDYGRDMGFRSYEEEEAFKMGCKHGYEKAMKEMHGSMGYREDYIHRGGYGGGDNYGNRDYGRGMRGDGMSGERRFPGYFPEDPYIRMGYRGDDDEMDERRRRDSRGRYM